MKKDYSNIPQEKIYEKNLFRSRLFKTLSPIIKYTFLILSIIFLIQAFKNSIGNVMDIFKLLDKDVYNRAEIADNYRMLVEKWGEWSIIGQEGSTFTVSFIDVSKAFFSGMMKLYSVLTITSFGLSITLGSILFPKLKEHYEEENKHLEARATLETNRLVKENKSKKGEWF